MNDDDIYGAYSTPELRAIFSNSRKRNEIFKRALMGGNKYSMYCPYCGQRKFGRENCPHCYEAERPLIGKDEDYE